MDISILLKYQVLDADYTKLNSNFKDEQVYKDYLLHKKLVSEASESVLKLGSVVEAVKKSFNETHCNLDELLKEAMDIKSIADTLENSSELSFHLKKLNNIFQEIQAYESKLNDIATKLAELSSKYKKLINDGKAYMLKKNEFEIQVQKLMAEKYDKELKRLMGEITALKSRIEPRFISRYEALKKSKTTPPYIVQYANNSCSGCGMDIDASLKVKLKNETIIECPNCNRILYLI